METQAASWSFPESVGLHVPGTDPSLTKISPFFGDSWTQTWVGSKGSEKHFPARDCIPLQLRDFEVKVNQSPLLRGTPDPVASQEAHPG